MGKLSVVINTLDEADKLPGVVGSVKGFADEIVVCDMESQDGTPEVAKRLGAKVFSHERLIYVEPARNFAVSKATGNWILALDVDEEIGSVLAKKIKDVIKGGKADYYRIARKNIIFGKWMKHSRWWPDYNIRLFRKGAVSWSEVIHAVPMTQGTGSDFEAKEDLAIVHHHYDSIEQYLDRMNRYTTAMAIARVKEGYKFAWQDLLVKPVNEFLSRYFFGQGYLDGIHGLALSLLQSFSELTLALKVWQAEKFKEGDVEIDKVIGLMRDKEKELRYWQSDASYRHSGSLRERIRRKLRI